VLRIQDVYPGSEFVHPGSRVKKFPDPGSGSASKNLSIFNPKNCFQALGKMIRDVYPGSGCCFFTISEPDPGVKMAPDTGYATLLFKMIHLTLHCAIQMCRGNYFPIQFVHESYKGYQNVFFYLTSSCRIWSLANLSWCILLCLRYQNWDTANRSCTEAPSSSRCSLWPGRPSSAWFQNRRSRSADSLRGRQQKHSFLHQTRTRKKIAT